MAFFNTVKLATATEMLNTKINRAVFLDYYVLEIKFLYLFAVPSGLWRAGCAGLV
jgi:hypothetical protein